MKNNADKFQLMSAISFQLVSSSIEVRTETFARRRFHNLILRRHCLSGCFSVFLAHCTKRFTVRYYLPIRPFDIHSSGQQFKLSVHFLRAFFLRENRENRGDKGRLREDLWRINCGVSIFLFNGHVACATTERQPRCVRWTAGWVGVD